MTMPLPADVTVIVPTLATQERANSLLRALDSLATADEQPAIHVIVVVNGNHYHAPLIEALSQSNVELIHMRQASLPAAILAGRKAVTSKYFCFLDDDDLYLPEAIPLRMAAIETPPAADLVVTNGLRRSTNREEAAMHRLDTVEADPQLALFHENWLASCGALFRSEAVPVSFFEDPQAYLEWTWLAFRLTCANCRIRVLDLPTFVINDTPGSASKSVAYIESHVSLYRRMLQLGDRRDVRKIVQIRLAAAYHTIAGQQLRAFHLGSAWMNHLRSLACRGGLRYIGFTHRLLRATLGFSSRK
jgi:glycosyltransferase involved in cell wall biosynthesis